MSIRNQVLLVAFTTAFSVAAAAAENPIQAASPDAIGDVRASEQTFVKLPCHDYLCAPVDPRVSVSRTDRVATTDVGNPVPVKPTQKTIRVDATEDLIRR